MFYIPVNRCCHGLGIRIARLRFDAMAWEKAAHSGSRFQATEERFRIVPTCFTLTHWNAEPSLWLPMCVVVTFCAVQTTLPSPAVRHENHPERASESHPQAVA